MIKIYRIAKVMNNYSFVLRGKTGNSLRYVFENGSVVNNTPARLMLRNQYAQDLLEQSDLFLEGQVLLETIREDDNATAEPKEEKPVLKKVSGVKTVNDAVEYVANEWGVAVKNGKQAKEYAAKQGVDFCNLKIK